MTPITDWNWFFSSLSQCGAALIGIIAAFIISKLLTENEKKDRIKITVRDFILEFQNLKTKLNNRYFDWYNRNNIETDELLDAINNGDFEGLSVSESEMKLYSLVSKIYYSHKNLEKLNQLIKREKEKIKSEPPKGYLQTYFNEFGNYRLPVIPPPIIPKMPSTDINLQLIEERDLIEGLRADCSNLIQKFQTIKSDIDNLPNNLKPLKITIWILMIGFLVTVVYPLHFIPMSDHTSPHIVLSISVFWQNLWSIQGILLLFLTIIIEGILIYFLFLIKSIKNGYIQAKADIKDEYLTLSGYSEYFKNKV
jgi:hypothetical protein